MHRIKVLSLAGALALLLFAPDLSAQSARSNRARIVEKHTVDRGQERRESRRESRHDSRRDNDRRSNRGRDDRGRSGRSGYRGNDRRGHNHAEYRYEGGYYKTVSRQVWVPGHTHVVKERVWHAGEFVTKRKRFVDHCGHIYYREVCEWQPGHWDIVEKEVFHPGYYKTVEDRVWVPRRKVRVTHTHHHG